jgi:hypothetical protein
MILCRVVFIIFGGVMIEFAFLWKQDERSEGRNYSIAVSGPK